MWLLKSETLSEIRAARMLAAPATAAQQTEFVAARARQSDSEAPAGLTIAGDTAQISVTGVLVAQPSFMLWLFGVQQTAYSEITEALSRVASDASVKRVSLFVDSPGGQVDGLFETLAALQAFNKPMTVTAACACSAAYAIAATTGKITATNPAAEFGSIGVAASVALDNETIDITSTEAPNKRPDVTTEQGRAVVREHLDAIHELFADAIASGRGTTVAAVNSGYGRGSTLLAGAALQRGMVDSVTTTGSSAKGKGSKAASAGHGPLTAAALEAFEHREPAPGESLTAFAERSMRRTESVDTRDLGDRVADAIDAQIDASLASQGRARSKSVATYSEPLTLQMPCSPRLQASSPDFDMGDAVADLLDAKKNGTKPPVFVTAPPTAAPEATSSDLGDLVADRIEAITRLGKPQQSMSR